MLERVFAQADLMDRVMERVGVDALTAARLDRGHDLVRGAIAVHRLPL